MSDSVKIEVIQQFDRNRGMFVYLPAFMVLGKLTVIADVVPVESEGKAVFIAEGYKPAVIAAALKRVTGPVHIPTDPVLTPVDILGANGENVKTEFLNSDYVTHHNDFVKACTLARHNSVDSNERAYWQRQVDTLAQLAKDYPAKADD